MCMRLKGLRLKKRGNSYFFCVPVEYIRHGNLDLDKYYIIEIYEE